MGIAAGSHLKNAGIFPPSKSPSIVIKIIAIATYIGRLTQSTLLCVNLPFLLRKQRAKVRACSRLSCAVQSDRKFQ